MRELRRVDAQPRSFDEPQRSADIPSCRTLAEEVADEDADLDVVALGPAVASVLADLPEREGIVLRMRYGLVDGQPRTLEEVGKEFGLTRERIRQLEAKAFTRIRRSPFVDELRDLVA